jgi:hypothetical protein
MKDKIKKKCDEIRDLLIEKNNSYGNSVFDSGILFDIEPVKAIQARINDKLNRIKNKRNYDNEDTLKDLTGYLILLQVSMDQTQNNSKDNVKENNWTQTSTIDIK